MTTPSPLAIIEQEHDRFRDPDLYDKLCAWLRDDLVRARHTRLAQPGRGSITLAATFIDISGAPRPTADHGEDIAAALLEREPTQFGAGIRTDDHPNNQRVGVLLIGGPGQGKSTVTQFLAQRHCAAALEYLRAQLDDTEVAVLDELAADPAAGPKLPPIREHCLPARIALPSLAAWMTRHDVPPALAVLGYLRELIAKSQTKDRQAPAPDDIEQLLEIVPWLFVFDGLDEVMAPDEHEQTIQAILAFVELLREHNTRALVVATTRPQTYRDQLSDVFEHSYLLELDKDASSEECVGPLGFWKPPQLVIEGRLRGIEGRRFSRQDLSR